MFRIAFFRINSILLISLFSCCSTRKQAPVLPYYDTPDFTPVFAANKVTSAHRIAAFSFIDQHGTKFSDSDVDGKVHIANFMFTKCGRICPVMTKHLRLIQEAFGENPAVAVLSFTVTPWIDSVGRLRAYARDNNIASPNWHLLTGSKSEIYRLARQSYFAEEELGFSKDSTEFLHTEHILLVDRNRRIRGIYNGTLQLEAEQLVRDVQVLLDEGRQ